MPDYDAVIVGAGMGGLSTAAFLTKCGLKTAVFEQHDKSGGYGSSFVLHGVTFDCGLEGLYELTPGQAVYDFLNSFSITLPVIKRKEDS